MTEENRLSWRKEYFGDEGWSIEISNPIVGGGPTSIGTSMVPPSDAQ